MITIYFFGKLKNNEISELFDYYKKLTNKYFKLKMQNFADPNRKISLKDLKNIQKSDELLIVLTEDGKQYTTDNFALKLNEWKNTSQKVSFVIGNAWGFDDELKNADIATLSLGKMTYPHEFSLILVLEQLYRCGNLLAGGKYHK